MLNHVFVYSSLCSQMEEDIHYTVAGTPQVRQMFLFNVSNVTS